MDRFSEIPKSKCGVLAACHHQPLCGLGDVDVDGEDNVDVADDDENSDVDVGAKDNVDAGDDDANAETSN